jgi:uncharacterized membrane protein YphA (DoxX/SURF4 family)
MDDLQTWLLACLRLSLGVVFMISTLGKVRAPRSFAATVASFNLLPRAWARSVALLLIGTEAVIAVPLLIGWHSQLAAATCALLLTIFIFAVGINLLRGRRDLECGCFGAKLAHKINLRHIGSQSALLAMALCVALGGGGLLSWDRPESGSLHLPVIEDVLPLVLALTGLCILFRLRRQLHRLFLLWSLREG